MHFLPQLITRSVQFSCPFCKVCQHLFCLSRWSSSFLACSLIVLDKCPGVSSIGISETACRIMAKAILHVMKSDIQDAVFSAFIVIWADCGH